MVGFLANDDLKERARAMLKKASVNVMAEFWDEILPRNNSRALAEIYRRLLARGFTAAQIAAWDDGAEYQSDIAIYLSLSDATVLQAFDGDLSYLDRRAELDTIPILTGGVVVNPASTTTSIVGHGRMKCKGDIFTMKTKW